MAAPRIHVERALAVGETIPLPEGAARHVAQVLRMRDGATLILFNGDGHDYHAELTQVARRHVEARVREVTRVDNESTLRITLLQGISKGERMDWVMQKSVELGVDTIVPIISERTVVRVDDARTEKKLAHWRGVVIAACEQSGRAVVPEVLAPMPLDAALGTYQGFVLDPGARQGLDAADGGDLALLIGPEGGLSEAELATARAKGWRGARLGPRVLRTETAALTALAVLQARLGDLG